MRLNKVLCMVLALLMTMGLASFAMMEEIEPPVDEVNQDLGEVAVAEPEEELSEAVDAEDAYVFWYQDVEIYADGTSYDPEFNTAYVGDVLSLTSVLWSKSSSTDVTWTVDNPKVADFSSTKSARSFKCKGNKKPSLYLNKAGVVVVRASCSRGSAAIKLYVIDPLAARYIGLKNVDPDEFTELYVQNPTTGKIGRMVFKVNAQLFNSLHEKVTDVSAARSIRWTSSDPKVAMVYKTSVPGQARVYVKRTGDVTITARLRLRTVSFDLHVYDTISPDRIYFVDEYGNETKTLRMEPGERFWLGWIIDGDSDAVLRSDSFTYKSHHTSIATVNRDGVVHALRKGNVKIDVKSFNGKKATLNVKIR